ncbi:alpha-2-macroglobulin family protein [Neolewinella antarctica]|uniref:Uncharacterized protein YfaS (Alpha-2-macroglobulin family) n=1 Tax=Neolewinella antarctica TaxID=442734 RepID=A0ABX0XEH8_9BACT|nr:alpha-2-macroglobulin family protein [Neolewinella antarctica]NJC27298.1 uncharacterized protein YfaS (alpha-2-macroglobulin family) [Neolewinella antarctica]
MRIFLLLLTSLLLSIQLMAQNYSTDYQAIEAFAKEGKYQSALTKATELYATAEKEGDQDDMLKALAYRATYTSALEEEGTEATLILLIAELDQNRNRPVVSSVLNYLIGKGYYTYAQQNAYRLRNATAVTTDTTPAPDLPLEDWNLRQLATAADNYLYAAAEKAGQQRTELAAIPAIITDAEKDARGLTLFDLLTQEIGELLVNPLLIVNNAAPATAQKYLVPATSFVSLDFADLAGETGPVRRLKLHQQELRYHLKNGGEGLLRADVRRVDYVRQLGAKTEDYLAALERMYRTYADIRGRDVLLVRQAGVYLNQPPTTTERPRVVALKILDSAKETTPEIRNAVARLRAQILRQSQVTTVEESNRADHNLLISSQYRNIDRLHYKLVRLAEDQLTMLTTSDYEVRDTQALLAGNVVAEKSFWLPENDDYAPHRTETWLPRQPAGAYMLITSSDADFSKQENMSLTPVMVSGMALVKFDDGERDYYEVQDLTTGAVRPGVEVSIHLRGNRKGNPWALSRTVVTDDQGRFDLPDVNRQRIYLVLRDGNDILVTRSEYVYQNDRRDRSREETFTPIFTDRAIYRPGQTVRLYGITMLKDRRRMPKLLTGQERSVTLRDANYQEVASQTAQSDEFGRFHLSFTLPEGGLTGTFRLETEGGSAVIRVEEYKRPKFEVELTGPDFAVGGEETEIAGKATLFAGPAVNDAAVNYRIFVEEQRWFWWYRGGASSDKELVGSGSVMTDERGEFTVAFTPDANLAGQRKSYNYTIEVDVADATGETQTTKATTQLRSEKPTVSLSVEEAYQAGDTLTIKAAGSDESLVIQYGISKVTNPGATLRNRLWDFPDRPILDPQAYGELFPDLPARESGEKKDWDVQREVVSNQVLNLAEGKGETQLSLAGYAAGYYRIDWVYADGTPGEPVVFQVSDLQNEQLAEGTLYTLTQETKEVRLGEPVTIQLYASVPLPRITYSFMSRKGVVTATTTADRTATITYTPTEEDRGGIIFDLAFVHDGRLHEERYTLDFGWDNKELAIDYATFRDKLRPGEPEKWTLTIRNADGSPVMAAALASMYDASLDQIAPARPWNLNPYPEVTTYRKFASLYLDNVRSGGGNSPEPKLALLKEETLPQLDLSPFSWDDGRSRIFRSVSGNLEKRSMMSADAVVDYDSGVATEESIEMEPPRTATPPPPPGIPQDDVKDAPVSIRKNLRETAIWLPELTTTDGGDLTVTFTSPEALTKWRLRVLTHDKHLNFGYAEREVLTQKELMVLPNVPRFLREGDALELTARVNNLSEEDMKVRVSIEYFDPITNEMINMSAVAGAGACTEEQIVGANSGKPFCFPLSIPDGFASRGPLGYRVIARGGSFSDGEENVFPVLSDRTLITVSQAFYLKKKDDKKVTIPLLANYDSETLQHVGYTFEATTNPAWLALKSLPYLMESPFDCTEQVANRYFANQLAFTTVSQKPILETVFRKWQADSNALNSELERNASLKNALLTETPWVRAAQSEAEQRARIASLFDLKKLAAEQTTSLNKLVKQQNNAGYYSWFPGGPEDRYVTQYVVETLARLQQLKAVTPDQTDQVEQIISAATAYLDQQLVEDYEKLLKRISDEDELGKHQPPGHVVHYLYARALAGAAPVVGADEQRASKFYLSQTFKTWTEYGLYEQALIAALGAAGDAVVGKATTKTIIESLRERAIRKDEFGMYWKYGRGFRWNNLPIETHCRILEAFQLGGGTTAELDDMRLWLLTNKRTNRWPTTKSTAAAAYALLNTGTDWVANDGRSINVAWPRADRALRLDDRLAEAQNSAEAATGAFSISITGDRVDQSLATVEVKNSANNIVWGGTYWQYTELASKVAASNDGPLTLERQLFHRIATEDGIRLDPITTDQPLAPGDRVTVRLIVRSDRDLDYVHLKDRRAATFEPVDQLSGYRFTNGLGYYAAPGDLATNFFIDNLPKGTYTIEYDLFATFSGTFSNGLGRVQCMYAPEFGANSAGAMISVE